MSTEATQGMGADVADLESMFTDESEFPANGEQTQTQVQTGTQQQQNAEVEVIDENGDLVVIVEPAITVDEDGNEIVVEVDPNEQQSTELVIPDDHKVKLVVDGKEVEYSFADLKNGVQKSVAADKRFEEAAAIRKEYIEKTQTISTREQQLEQVLTYYIGQSQTLMQSQEPNWAELLQNDPQKYLVERHNWEQKQATLAQARQVQANVQRQQAEQQQVATTQRLTEAKQKLTVSIPEWSDPKKAAEGALAIDRYLHEQGIAPEMRSQIDSAEVLLVARKAMLYDQAVAAAKARKGAKPAVVQGQQQQVQGQRVVQRQQQGRVERPGAATPAQTAASRQNLSKANATKAFNANPSVDTLAEFFG